MANIKILVTPYMMAMLIFFVSIVIPSFISYRAAQPIRPPPFLSSSRRPAPNGLPTPPYDKSTSNRFRSSCFLYLIRKKWTQTKIPTSYGNVCVTHILWASVHTSLNGYIRFSICLAPGTQNLPDFPLLHSISQHRITNDLHVSFISKDEHRLRAPRPVATSVWPTSCGPQSIRRWTGAFRFSFIYIRKRQLILPEGYFQRRMNRILHNEHWLHQNAFHILIF